MPSRDFFLQVEPDYNRVDTVKRREAARNFLSDFESFGLWGGLGWRVSVCAKRKRPKTTKMGFLAPQNRIPVIKISGFVHNQVQPD